MKVIKIEIGDNLLHLFAVAIVVFIFIYLFKEIQDDFSKHLNK
jgi:hypothetical protein